MGQYYRVVSLDKKVALSPSGFGNGLKLMEHSYHYNAFVGEVIKYLMGDWNNTRVIWSGDYSNQSDEEWDENLYPSLDSRTFDYKGLGLDSPYPFYQITKNGQENVIEFFNQISESYVFINYSKEIYCKLDCCEKGSFGLTISPIPLLLANSNGGGGGDYFSEYEISSVGSWAYDNVGIVKKEDVPSYYEEVTYNFKE